MKVLLSTAYWPNQAYFYYILNSETVVIEQFEHYRKQSFRNRTQILSANGVINLAIPVLNEGQGTPVKDIKICYREKWRQNHWRAITSAYRNSPYFEYFEQDISTFYTGETELLLEYNLRQTELILKILRQKIPVGLSTGYQTHPDSLTDLRELIHPKRALNDQQTLAILNTPYYQTFGNKFDFMPNLSMLDLLFNTGLGAVGYLRMV